MLAEENQLVVRDASLVLPVKTVIYKNGIVHLLNIDGAKLSSFHLLFAKSVLLPGLLELPTSVTPNISFAQLRLLVFVQVRQLLLHSLVLKSLKSNGRHTHLLHSCRQLLCSLLQ